MQPTVLCDLHLTPMTQSVTTIGHDTLRNQPWSDEFRKCTAPGCRCQFNRNKGYVDILDTRIVGTNSSGVQNTKSRRQW